ncbi:U-box domain-containing protein 13 [Lactuca sativa]|nr:U-box domain-containing protein 13 [Lactuca sativa]
MIQSVHDKLSITGPDRLSAGEIRLLKNIMEDNRVAIRIYTYQLMTLNSLTQEQAITAILNLSLSEDNKRFIVSCGAVPGIVLVLKVGSMEACENAAASISSVCVTDENREIIGAEGAIQPLVLLLTKGTQKGKKVAIIALFNLCLDQANKGRAVRAGVVPILMELLTEPQGVLKKEALSILATLSSHEEGKLAIGKAEVVPALVEVIGSGSRKNKENAAAVLVELCYDHQKYLVFLEMANELNVAYSHYLVEAQEHGVMEKLMDLLQHGTDMGKRKARRLLEIIEDHRRSHDEYVEITLDVRDDSVSIFSVKTGDRADVEDPQLNLLPKGLEKRSHVGQNMSTRMRQISKELKRLANRTQF